MDNQRLIKPDKGDKVKLNAYYQQYNELRKIQANAHYQLADACYHIKDFVTCESSLTLAVKQWEKLVLHNPEYQNELSPLLLRSYETLKLCYEAMGKLQMAQYMDTRKTKLLATMNSNS